MPEQLPLLPEAVDPTSKIPPMNWKALAKQQAASIAALKKQIANLQAMLDRRIGLCWEPPPADTYKADADRWTLPLRLRLDPSLSLPAQDRGNLILEGDNLLALRLLARTHRGRIDAIFIDPPYNTGSTSWVYNDQRIDRTHRFRHSLWLDFLAQRLAIARDLLSPTGILAVCIGDETRWLLEGLLEQIMPGRRIGSLVWRTRAGAADPRTGLAINHEHILLYGGPNAKIVAPPSHKPKTKKYKNPDADPNGPWRWGPLVAQQPYTRSPKSYFPIQNPKTGFWYPCFPDKVWRHGSRHSETRLQGPSLEEMIELGQVRFPPHPKDGTIWHTKEELLDAIARGDVPLYNNRFPILREDLPDLDFWIGRPVGFGRPSKKFYQNKQDQRPLVVSSWLLSPQDTPLDEPWIDEFESGMTKDGGDRLYELFGRRVFDFPKPVSLVKAILQRISPPDAVVLDFFAGSGTTAEAVLALNAEDDGDRRFILVSNTEADAKNPEKNLCRDVCRERVRRVIQADTKAPPKGKQPAPHADGFAYVRLDLMPSEEGTLVDAAQDPHTAWTAIQIAAGAPVTPWPDGQDLAVVRLPSREDIPERWVAYAPRWSAQIGKAIEALDGPGTLWTDRPGQARQALARRPDVAVEDAPKTLEAWLAPVEPFVR